jgi:cell fate regulator YaaT (PSP1 superfamily)
MPKQSLIPTNIREEFIRKLREANGGKAKREQARTLAVSRLRTGQGNSWWNEHHNEVTDELNLIESKVQ